MRFAIVVALAVHAGLIGWLSPRAHDPVALPPAVAATQTEPVPDIVDVVLLDETTPAPVTTLPVAHASTGGASRHAVTASRHTSDVAMATTTLPSSASTLADPAGRPARDYFAMRKPDLSPPVVDAAPDRAPSRGGDSELRPSGHGTYQTDLGGSSWQTRTATAHVARDGTVRFENAPDFDIHFGGLGVVGKFNADDWMMRKAGIDPYASAKLAYLDRTRDERARIAQVNRMSDLAHSQLAMQRNVEAARAIVDPAARKQALFELWDDVAETGDDALVQAGASARAYLVGAIRAMRPSLVFTPEELARLNARRHSRAVFAPYESEPGDTPSRKIVGE
ncbi:MAG TPA: hypothetical protein VFQ53_35085 [Kofleriaceae bacterium]|nr:hypothetical protein [Kofleriaceae bacterium]